MSDTTERKHLYDLPRGIRLVRFDDGQDSIVFYGQYRDTSNNGNERPIHLYTVHVIKVNSNEYAVWIYESRTQIAKATLFTRRSRAEYIAIKMLKAYLTHLAKESKRRRRQRKAKSAAKAEEVQHG